MYPRLPSRSLFAAVAVVLLLVLAGCSSSNDDLADDNPAPAEQGDNTNGDTGSDDDIVENDDSTGCVEAAAEILTAANSDSMVEGQDENMQIELARIADTYGDFATTTLRCEAENTFDGPADSQRQVLTNADAWNVALYFVRSAESGPEWELTGFVEVGGGQ